MKKKERAARVALLEREVAALCVALSHLIDRVEQLEGSAATVDDLAGVLRRGDAVAMVIQ